MLLGTLGSGEVYQRNLNRFVYSIWNPKGHDIVCLKSPAQELATGKVKVPTSKASGGGRLMHVKRAVEQEFIANQPVPIWVQFGYRDCRTWVELRWHASCQGNGWVELL